MVPVLWGYYDIIRANASTASPHPPTSRHHCIVHHQSANRARAAGQTRLGSALGFSVSLLISIITLIYSK